VVAWRLVATTQLAAFEPRGIQVGLQPTNMQCIRNVAECGWSSGLHRPAENSDFSTEDALGFPGRSMQVLERATLTRESQNIRNWTL